TIYQANKDQIRNPRWIYPGQVFVLPEGNAAWEDTEKTDPPG
ncbi:MAG: LysM peptidoglycan-binding domain-containing protein, partial [Bauldia sp.]|nr:LysM peptidoglycan-binding domain-containing protein [Bauldia sp.]